jgi:threonine dehydratase
MRTHVTAIATCSEGSIVAAMRMVWEAREDRDRAVFAVASRGDAEGTLDVRGKRVGVVLTGGIVDLDRLPWQ